MHACDAYFEFKLAMYSPIRKVLLVNELNAIIDKLTGLVCMQKLFNNLQTKEGYDEKNPVITRKKLIGNSNSPFYKSLKF